MRSDTPDPRPLRQVQEAFLADLVGLGPRKREERVADFAPPPRGSLEDRWAVYADGYVARVAEALEDDYPAVRRVLGPGAFRSLAARYLRARPPRSFDLGAAGDRLAGFLESDLLARDLPFLPDLARLEWAVRDAFIAPDVEGLLWADLVSTGPEAAAERPLALRPGTALLRSRWPLLDLWRCKDVPDSEVSLQVEGHPQTVLVLRRGLDVRCRLADEDEARLIEAALDGKTLAAIQDASGGDEGRASRLVEAFRRLVEEGAFAKEPPAPPASC